MRLLTLFILLLAANLGLGQNTNYVPNEILVQFQNNTDHAAVIRIFEKDVAHKIYSVKLISEIANIYQITFEEETLNLDASLNLLNKYTEVSNAQKNHYLTERETIPTDVLFIEQWHLNNTGAGGGVEDADIDAPEAWDITTGGLTTHNDTIVVCIIEGSGVDISHVDLQGNLWKNYGEIPDDGIDNDGNGYIDDFDGWNVQSNDDAVASGSHGTRVAGMIGAKGNNDIGISGVNWDVKMMIIKGQSASNEASVIAAYSYPLKMRRLYNESYGAEGAFVVATNASWGIDNGDPADSPLWCAMYDTLGAAGIISVGATTNGNVNVDVAGDLPTTCSSEYFIGVTMTNSSDVRAGAGYGVTHVDLAAPGSSVRLTVPTDTYSFTSGTSFATPCVTGAIALAYSSPCAEFINRVKFDPAAAALEMKGYILDGVDAVASLSGEVGTGGRLNVNNTINLLMDGCDEDACVSPYNIRISDITDTAITIDWEGFSSDYIVVLTEAGLPPVEIEVTGEFNLDVADLSPCTNYTLSIIAICAPDDLSDPSFEINFTTDGCCVNPLLVEFDKTETDLTVTWGDILYATQYNLRYALIDTDDWTEFTDVSAPYTISDLAPCTEYELQIYTVCGDSTRGYSESQIIRTKGCGACTELEYCPVLGANDNLEWIDKVTVNGIVQETGSNNGWLQSEHVLTALTPGESYTITINPGFSGSSFTERYSIYIDFNQNGVFDLPEERLVDDVSILGPATQLISIPGGAPIGITKIRIGMSALSDPIACPTANFFGEYEDYCVYIGSQSNLPENEIELSLYPNPVTDQLFIQTTEEIEQINVYANDGRLIANIQEFNTNSISVANYTSGVYIIAIETKSGVIVKKFIKA